MDRLATATKEYEKMENQFEELEAAFDEANPGTTLRYKQLFEQKGGEQFRTDTSRLKCKFSHFIHNTPPFKI